MKKLLTLLAVLLLLGLTVMARAYDESNIWDEQDVYANFFCSDPSFLLTWAANPDADGYDVEILHIDEDPIRILQSFDVPVPQLDLPKPATGNFHVAVRVRPYKAKGTSQELLGAWCYSTDKNCSVVWSSPTINAPQGWIVYWRIAAPTVSSATIATDGVQVTIP